MPNTLVYLQIYNPKVRASASAICCFKSAPELIVKTLEAMLNRCIYARISVNACTKRPHSPPTDLKLPRMS